MSSAESNALPPPRFPPTRRVLWDRTPGGPAQRVPLLAFAPKICLGRAAGELARQAQEAQRRPKALRLVLRGSEGSEPETWLAERLDERGLSQDEVALDLGALPETRAVEEIGFSTSKPGATKSASSRCRLAPSMAQTLHRLLEPLPGPALCAAEPSGATEKFWRWAGAVAVDRLQGTTQLRLAAKYPKWAFHATALARPLRTLETPLLQALLAPKSSKSLGCGYLTLDERRCVLCLMQNEALAQEVPLVGVWVDLRDQEVSNLPTLAAHPAVWAAAAHFVHQRSAKEKVWVEASTFLIMAAVRQRAMPPEAGLLFAEFRFEEEPSEGLYLASMDYDQASVASMGDMKLETFTADYSDLVKMADQAPHEKVNIKAHSLGVAEMAASPKQKRMEAGAGGFRPEEPRAEAPRQVEEECSQCGAGYVAEARFCSRCGQRRPSTPVQTPMVEMTLAKPIPAVPAWGVPGESSPPAATPSSRRSDGPDDIPLRQIVGQQQLQLGVLQQQLQSVQDLLVQLVARDSSPPVPPPPPVAPLPAPAMPAELAAAHEAPAPPILKADACIGDSEVSVAHAATSPIQKSRMVSTGLQAAPLLQDAAVGDAAADDKVASKTLELPKLRDSADTAGGQSPRPMETASTWATMGVPRIICPADLSPCRSEDDLSDGSSLELMAGDFTLTYHGDQIGFY